MEKKIIIDEKQPNVGYFNGRTVEVTNFAQWCGDNGYEVTEENADSLRKQWVADSRVKIYNYFAQ